MRNRGDIKSLVFLGEEWALSLFLNSLHLCITDKMTRASRLNRLAEFFLFSLVHGVVMVSSQFH